MPPKIDLNDIHNILASVKNGSLKDALSIARKCATALGMWKQIDSIAAHERTYRAMVQYMDSETDSDARHRSLAVIKEDLLRLSDAMRLELDINSPRPGHESDRYAAAVRTRRFRTSPDSLPQILTGIALADTEESRYNLIDELFTLIATTQHLSASESEALDAMITDPDSDQDATAMTLSALSIANLYYYDRAKLALLLHQPDNEPAALTARRLTGIYLTLWRHPARIGLDPDIACRLDLLLDNKANVEAMRKTALAVLAARDTQRINDKMQNDIIPELKRLQSDFMKRFPSQADMASLLDPEKNPEWEDMLHDSSLGDSLQELGDMQAQGGDVMMLAFSNLKNFPFFNHPGNWLLPYSPEHPALKRVAAANGDMLDVIDSAADFLCDADKYSLALAIERMPHGHGAMMMEKMREQFENYRQEKSTTLSKDTEPAVYSHITLYVRSLARLINLFPHQGLRLPNPFVKAVTTIDMPLPDGKLTDRYSLESISDFLFSRGYYAEALPVLQRLENHIPDSAPLMEKIGYALQHTASPSQALEYYHRAETLTANPGEWLLRRLASLSRATGQHMRAVEYWQRLAQLDPDDPKTAMLLANAQFDAGLTADALKNYYKTDYLRGSSEKTWRPIAWCEFMLGNYEKAQDYYDRLLILGDDTSDLLNAGHLALARGRLSNAIELYSRAARLHPDGMEGIRKQLSDDAEILSEHGLDKEAQAMLTDRLSYIAEG